MKTTEIRLSDLKNKVAKSVLDTIRLLETRYGAMHYKDSGQKESPTWIYRLPRYDDAMVGIRMNKRDLTLYMHDRTCDGKYLRDTVAPKKVANVYPRDGRPAGSICRYLKPSSENEVLRLELGQEDIEAVLTAFFGELPVTSSASEIGSDRNKPVRNAADFLASLERKSEIGHLGECCALDDEIQRLKRLGCSRPEDYVLHVSLIDVARGYDIESTWPGEERYIEVKATTCAGSDFFLTANERSVLTRLGERAWLYRIVVGANGQSKVETRLQNPMKFIKEEQLTVIAWSVSAII